ncbi:pyridoxal phosphate-dependent aminotransferase [Pediococcus argentinicus]|uniref:pyridoxal phosphate-dependent aminotransferase n=1 Tax=Pediococcus argentinicus TaxID=480391 RepID=UPI0033901BE7
MKFSKRVLNVSPSATLAVSAQAKKMQADGIDVINLSTGEPDFATPVNIQNAAIDSIQNGSASYYTPVKGLPDLQNAVVKRVFQDYQRTIDPSQVALTVGAKMGLYALFQAVLEPGDSAMIIAPYWVSYEEQIKLAGANVQVVHPQANDMKATPPELTAAMDDSTKILILNTPQNPSGLVYSRKETEAIAKWALEHNVLLVADEIYGKLVYNNVKFTSVLELSDELVNNTVIINGVSKAYAMTGWRLGYLIANPEIINKVGVLLGHMTSNPTTVAQYAAIEALNGDQKAVFDMRDAFEKRLNETYALLNDIPGLKLEHKPEGAFYLFPNVTELMKQKGFTSSSELALALLNDAHVAVVAGEGFGMSGYIRLSYATSQDKLNEACRRIKEFAEA